MLSLGLHVQAIVLLACSSSSSTGTVCAPLLMLTQGHVAVLVSSKGMLSP